MYHHQYHHHIFPPLPQLDYSSWKDRCDMTVSLKSLADLLLRRSNAITNLFRTWHRINRSRDRSDKVHRNACRGMNWCKETDKLSLWSFPYGIVSGLSWRSVGKGGCEKRWRKYDGKWMSGFRNAYQMSPWPYDSKHGILTPIIGLGYRIFSLEISN